MSHTQTPEDNTPEKPKKKPRTRQPVMVRIPFPLVPGINAAAKRLGMSRAAYMLAATIEKVEQGRPR